MKEHSVIAELVDIETGERHFPPSGFTPHNEEQAERLIRAGCLSTEPPKKAAAERAEGGDDAPEPKPAAKAAPKRKAS